MSCTEGLTRILVFVANFAFLLVGGALLTVGILYAIHFTRYTDAIPDDYQTIQYVPMIAIGVGSIIFLIAFLGCCGAVKSNTCMLTTYAAILFIIFLLQVGLGVYALMQIQNTDDLKEQVDKQVTSLFSKYKKDTDIGGVIDLIQQNLQCCGTSSPLSWTTSGMAIPSSCYNDSYIPFIQGCSSVLYEFILQSVKIIAIVALAISVTEIVGAILALCLTNCINSNNRRAAYYS